MFPEEPGINGNFFFPLIPIPRTNRKPPFEGKNGKRFFFGRLARSLFGLPSFPGLFQIIVWWERYQNKDPAAAAEKFLHL